ncbi:hypothetical protein V8G54_004160 [Vigna mungo]|uniref:Secreted protein n=1 Tax=Vigna mungo TaxID=3915 RepID=A0AAQ3PBA9_VIGMU
MGCSPQRLWCTLVLYTVFPHHVLCKTLCSLVPLLYIQEPGIDDLHHVRYKGLIDLRHSWCSFLSGTSYHHHVVCTIQISLWQPGYSLHDCISGHHHGQYRNPYVLLHSLCNQGIHIACHLHVPCNKPYDPRLLCGSQVSDTSYPHREIYIFQKHPWHPFRIPPLDMF